MADDSSVHISDSSSTAVADPAAHFDAELMALFEQRVAARALTREADDDDADAAYDELDRVDALIVSSAARTLDGICLKTNIYRDIACGDAELALPTLSSLVADLRHVPLDDQAIMRSIFATLALPLLSPSRPEPTNGEGV